MHTELNLDNACCRSVGCHMGWEPVAVKAPHRSKDDDGNDDDVICRRCCRRYNTFEHGLACVFEAPQSGTAGDRSVQKIRIREWPVGRVLSL